MGDIDEEYDIDYDIVEYIEEGNNIYDKLIELNDEFIIYFKDNRELLLTISEISIDEKKVIFDKNVELELDDNNKILLKTSNYEILDIEKISEIDIDKLDDITNTNQK